MTEAAQGAAAALNGAHRKYIAGETLVSTVFNTVISIVFASLVVRSQPGGASFVPLWGPTGMAFDFVPTVFMITLVTTLIVTLIARKRLRDGKAPALSKTAAGPLGWAPRMALLRAILFAAGCALILVPASIGALIALGVDALPAMGFVVFKAIYGAVLSLLITPPIARAALAS